MSNQPNSQLIRTKCRLMNGPRVAASEKLWSQPQLENLVPWILTQSFMVANASVPVMRLAEEQCRKQPKDDAVAAGFAAYLKDHIEEETGHDEQCLEDLELLGFSSGEIRARIPWSAISTLVGLQYYWILHQHPIGLAGYLATIEGAPISVERIESVSEQTGLPIECFRTLLWHAHHDREHSAELDELIDSLPITPEQMGLIGVNIALTNSLAAKSVQEMIELSQNGSALGSRR